MLLAQGEVAPEMHNEHGCTLFEKVAHTCQYVQHSTAKLSTANINGEKVHYLACWSVEA